MLVRERLAISVAVLAAAVLWVLPGCSTNNPRDINDGTDVALDFVPPDAGHTVDAGATTEVSHNSVDAGGVDVSVEVYADGLQDEAVSDLDAAIDGAN
jgi:hypothetical protein